MQGSDQNQEGRQDQEEPLPAEKRNETGGAEPSSNSEAHRIREEPPRPEEEASRIREESSRPEEEASPHLPGFSHQTEERPDPVSDPDQPSDHAPPPPDQGSMLRMAVFVEGGMGLVAIALGMLFGYNPLTMIHVEPERWKDALGLLTLLPMLVGFFLVARLSFFDDLRKRMDELILPIFKGLYLSDLFWLSILAGVGEELLFRGFLHLWMLDWLGLYGAVMVTSVVFGLLHWITPAYGILAGIMGLLMSASLIYTDNLLVPILIHGIYDFFALWYYLRVVHRAGPADVSPPQ